MPEIFIFALIIGGSLLIVGGLLYFVAVHKPRERAQVANSIDTLLFRVLLPREENPPAGEARKHDPKEIMTAMEQLYSAFGAIKTSYWHYVRNGSPTVSFEMALPHIGEQVIFYVASPRLYAQFITSQLHGLFPSAKIDRIEDYNIFHPTGVSGAATVTLKKNPVLSLRTYRDLGSLITTPLAYPHRYRPDFIRTKQ